MKEYEYAGFRFIVSESGDTLTEAAPGQHPAAYKEKHLRAAREAFKQERK